MNRYIFTYGTLMKDFHNHKLIEHLGFIDYAITCNKYQMYPQIEYIYPFVIKSQSNNFIFGEVYKLNSNEDLEKLDLLEDYPYLYLREEISVKLTNNKIIKALIYFKNEENEKEEINLNHPIKKWTKEISKVTEDYVE